MTKGDDQIARLSSAQVRKEFGVVYPLKGGELLKMDDTHQEELVLVLCASELGRDQHYVFAANRMEFLELARHILRTLDPSPENQILATLQRIEKLLEQRT